MRAFGRWLIALAAVAPLSLSAAEVCVMCEEPGAVYRCEAEGFSAGDGRANWACVTELAKTEGHKSCAVDRRAAGPCDGPLKVVRRDLVPADPLAAAPEAEAVPENPATAADERSPTVAGELKKAGQSASEQIGKMGEAVGAGAQKAWKCLATFMQEC